MDIGSRRFADALVLSPVGRIDHASSEAFRGALSNPLARCAAGGDHIVLDFTSLEYISSAGLRVLMLAHRQAANQGGKLVISGLQPVVREIFEISRFTMIFEIFPSVRDALASVSARALASYDATSTETAPGRMTATYEDTAPPHNPFAARAPSAAGTAIGGIGLLLVAGMTIPEYRYTAGKNHISLVIGTS